jgi:hypothetical protein
MMPWIEYLETYHIANIPCYKTTMSDAEMPLTEKTHQEMYRRQFLFRMARPITCKDGFRMSVQASSGHYCSPRFTLPYSRYTHFEVQAAQDVFLMPYAESCSSSIHPQVPRGVITKCIDYHGGLSDELEYNEYFDGQDPMARTDSS